MHKKPLFLYVSTSGKDSWYGDCPEHTRGKTGPFATIGRAQAEILALKRRKGGLARPVRVEIRGGVYALAQTLEFTAADSGSADAPVTYAAYPGEMPVLSGGRRITGWTVAGLRGKPCWTAHLPEVAAGDWSFAQLFVDGRRAPRTRFPRSGYFRFADLPDGKHGLFHGTRRANFAAGEINPAWKNLADVKIVALQHWFESHLHIEGVDEAQRLVTFQAQSISDLFDETGHNARYWLENIFEELDEPGQWYLDRADGRLFYLPRPGETPENTEIIAPRIATLVRFNGRTAGGRVCHVRLENLALRHAEWQLPRCNAGAVQSAFNLPGAVIFSAAEDCALYGCEIAHVSQYGVEVQLGSLRNRILACRIFDLGAGGVKINHESPMYENTEGSGARNLTSTGAFLGMDDERRGWEPLPEVGPLVAGLNRAPGMHTEIADCTIHDGGLLYASSIGIWIGDSGYNRIHHNEICNFPYTAISSGWAWSYAPAFTIGNRFEFNHIHHIGLGVLSDLGGIYTLGLHPGGVIIGNHIHDIAAYGYGGAGIYPDQGSSCMFIENNLVYRCMAGGLGLHYGRDNVVRNNIFAFFPHEGVHRARAECMRSFVFERNIVYGCEGRVFSGNFRSPNVVIDGNLYWSDGLRPLSFNASNFEDWQACGYDLHSRIADPLFSDAATGNFALRADSPALALGLQPIDPSLAGPRNLDQRPASLDDCPARRHPRRPIVVTRFEEGAPMRSRADRDLRRLSVEKEMIIVKQGEPTALSLTVENVGAVPAKGGLSLTLVPKGAGRLVGKRYLSYALKPGELASISFQATINPGQMHVFVEMQPDDPALPPSAVMLSYVLPPVWSAPRLADISSIMAIEGALSALKPLLVNWAGQAAAELRFGLAGDRLALLAHVNDTRMEQMLPPWDGSCIEVFGSRAGLERVGQVILQPETGEQPAAGWQQLGGFHPEPRISLQSRRVDGGYVLSALIPADLIQIDPAADEFLIEFNITLSLPQTAGAFVRPLAFNAPAPPSSNIGYAQVKVTP